MYVNNDFSEPSGDLLQPIHPTWLPSGGVEAAILRLDRIHPDISGNKWFKLKYNIKTALQQQKNSLLTFGGARSNHIAAAAATGHFFKLQTIGIIRGEAAQIDNPTLSRAKKQGMQLHFISREAYRRKGEKGFLQKLQNQFPNAFIIPEGGKNRLGIKGAEDILRCCDSARFTHICCPVGTGATLAGIIAAAHPEQKIVGFSALKKAGEQRALIEDYLKPTQQHGAWEVLTRYHFGGFARKTVELQTFMHDFQNETNIPLDFVYTAKMMFGIQDLIAQGYFAANSKLLIIHTGGLQGNK